MNLGGGSNKLIVGLVSGLIVGLLLGALLFWVVFPVQYQGGYSYSMFLDEKARYVQLVADSYALDRDVNRARSFLDRWEPDEVSEALDAALPLAQAEGDPAKVQRLADLRQVLGVAGPAGPGQPEQATPEPQPTADRPVAPLTRARDFCIYFIIALLALIGIYLLVRWLMRRRAAEGPVIEGEPAAPPRVAPAVTVPIAAPEEWQGIGQPPLGHFITTYKLGEDTYDESFSIETPAGEFLGECGVGISETIDKGEPDKVTAFEVWLFDKSDIRTVTKVLMSDHAYHDETLRAKLSPKGEALLATVGVPFLLETTGLQVQVTVTDLGYGEGPLPAKSFFRQLTIELVAMARPAA